MNEFKCSANAINLYPWDKPSNPCLAVGLTGSLFAFGRPFLTSFAAVMMLDADAQLGRSGEIRFTCIQLRSYLHPSSLLPLFLTPKNAMMPRVCGKQCGGGALISDPYAFIFIHAVPPRASPSVRKHRHDAQKNLPR